MGRRVSSRGERIERTEDPEGRKTDVGRRKEEVLQHRGNEMPRVERDEGRENVDTVCTRRIDQQAARERREERDEQVERREMTI